MNVVPNSLDKLCLLLHVEVTISSIFLRKGKKKEKNIFLRDIITLLNKLFFF